jgi:hypothetical protein
MPGNDAVAAARDDEQRRAPVRISLALPSKSLPPNRKSKSMSDMRTMSAVLANSAMRAV